MAGSLDAGDPTQTGRLARAGAPGATVCGTWHASFGYADTANQRFYDIYSFTNATAADACATFMLVWTGTEAMFEVAYTTGLFNPADITSSYLGDGNAQTSPMSMGIVMAAGGSLDVVVHAISPGVGSGAYTLIASGAPFGTAGCFPSSVSTAVTPNAPVTGDPIKLVAAVTPTAGTPTGSMTFMEGGVALGTASLDATGTASLTIPARAVGTYTLSAAYSGDAIYAAASSAPFNVTVSAAPTTTAVSSSQNPQAGGAPVTFTALVTVTPPHTGAPTGTVTFLDGATTLGTGTLASGQAIFTTAALAMGSHTITASYGGDAAFKTSTSAALTQTIQRFTTTVTVGVAPSPSSFGDVVEVSATVASPSGFAPGTPTGMVTFTDGSTTLGSTSLDAAGRAALLTTSLSVGTHAFTAAYGGDATQSPASGSVVHNVNRAVSTTALTTSSSVSVFGETFSVTATVTSIGGGPGGTVVFQEGGATLGEVALDGSGVATVYLSGLAVGAHDIVASYAGDPTFSGSASAAVSHTVNRAATTTKVVASSNPALAGPVSFNAMVTATAPGAGAPSGMVSFSDGVAPLGTASIDAGGMAALTVPNLGTGSHAISATYAGDASFTSSFSAVVPQVIDGSAPMVSLAASRNPSSYGQDVTLTATVTVTGPDAATGTVTFQEGATTLGAGALNGGQATLALHGLTAGSHVVTATYGGNASYVAGATGSATLVVGKATTATALASSPRPSVVGDTVTLTATVTSSVSGASEVADAATSDLEQPGGLVTFNDGATTIGTAPLVAGSATLTTDALTAGTHTLTASYGGAGNYAASASAPLSHEVSASRPDGGSDAGTSPRGGGGGGCGCDLGDRAPSGAAASCAGIAALLCARRRKRASRS
jgi:hypothetical protein